MIVKTFSSRKSANMSACIDYLAKPVNGEVTREGASLLSGDIELTQELINQASEKFKHGYTAGVLSFEEKDISTAEKMELMSSFEECLLPGIDPKDYNVLWVEHTDKDRLELNFVVPRIHVGTEAHLQPYFHDVDQHRHKHWQEMSNAKYGYSSPDDPEKKHAITFNAKEPQSRKEIKIAIDELLKEGEPNDRSDVVSVLNDIEGVEVSRTVKKSISVKIDGLDKPLRLTGAYFEQDYRADRFEKESIGREQSEFQKGNEARYELHAREYRSRLQRVGAKNREKYNRISERNDKSLYKEVGERGEVTSHAMGGVGLELGDSVASPVRDPTTSRNDTDTKDKDILANESERKSNQESRQLEEIREIFKNGNRANSQTSKGKSPSRDSETGEAVTFATIKNRESTATNNSDIRRAKEHTRGLKQTIKRIDERYKGWKQKLKKTNFYKKHIEPHEKKIRARREDRGMSL